ncbi:oligosaccharide flippase family protein [Synechococcus sp. PCC 7336]|uniref:oligosaccharide flippase family protein n=1 Tax=Synechococcus sp. PCC 7336 TaxID=195250 RepID=UPI000347EC4F|nr:oligosaccharide flippase family protein [Synechococcus sp. PCC 7336]
MAKATAANIAKSSLWLTASFVLAKCLQLLAQIVLARLLMPEDFGIWGMVLVVTALAGLFKDATVAGVLIQRGLADKTTVNTVYSLGVSLSVLMFLLQSALGYPLSLFFDQPLVFPLATCAAFTFLIGAGAGAHGAVLQRQMKFRELALSQSVAGLARMGVAIAVAASGAGVWAFVAAELASITTSSILRRSLSGYRFDYQLLPNAEAFRNVRSYIGSSIGINLAVYTNTNSDNMIVGRLLGAQSLGFYNLAYQLAMMPTFVLSQVNRVSFSVLSQQTGQDRQHYVCRSLELYAMLSAPVYGVAYAIAPWLIPQLYGAEWTPAVLLFQIVLIFAYTRGFMSILGTTLNAIDRPELNAKINWALVPLSIPAFFIGARLGGIQGVAMSVALVMGIGASVWFWLATCRATGWSEVTVFKPVVIPTVSIGSAIGMSHPIQLNLNLSPGIQPLLVLVGYIVIAGILSKGKAFSVLIDTGKRVFNLSPKPLEKNTSS